MGEGVGRGGSDPSPKALGPSSCCTQTCRQKQQQQQQQQQKQTKKQKQNQRQNQKKTQKQEHTQTHKHMNKHMRKHTHELRCRRRARSLATPSLAHMAHVARGDSASGSAKVSLSFILTHNSTCAEQRHPSGSVNSDGTTRRRDTSFLEDARSAIYVTWPRGVTASTLDPESSNRGSNPREALRKLGHSVLENTCCFAVALCVCRRCGALAVPFGEDARRVFLSCRTMKLT